MRNVTGLHRIYRRIFEDTENLHKVLESKKGGGGGGAGAEERERERERMLLSDVNIQTAE